MLVFLASLVPTAPAAGKPLGPIPPPELPEAAAPPAAPAGHVRLALVFRLDAVLRTLDALVPRELRKPRHVDTTSVDDLDRKSEERGGPGHGPEYVHVAEPQDAPYEGPVPWRGMLRRGPWTVAGRGDSLTILTPLEYSVDVLLPGRPPARCGSAAEPWRGQAGCISRLAWGDGWTLETRAQALPTSFERRCKPKPPGLNFTRRLNQEVNERLAEVLPAGLDSAMRHETLAGRAVREALAFLAEPVQMDSGAWLHWNPGRVTVDPPRLSGDSVTAEVCFETRPEILPARGAQLVPALGEPNVRLGGDVFRVPYHCWVDYADIERSIRRLHETRDSAEGSGLAVPALAIRGARNRVLVSLDLTGPVEGTVHLMGALEVTEPEYMLRVPDLDWSPDTRRRLRAVLTGSAGRSLLAELEQIRLDVRRAFSRPLQPCLVGWERALLQSLRPDLGQPATISASFNRREGTDIFCTDRAIGVRFVTSGRARLVVERRD